MKLLVVCFLILSSHCFSQTNVCGNWLSTTHWSDSFTKLKRNGKVIQFTADCKDRGTKRIGTWYQQNDTIYITTQNRSASFFLKENKLYEINRDGEICDPKYGIPRSKVKTIVGAKEELREYTNEINTK